MDAQSTFILKKQNHTLLVWLHQCVGVPKNYPPTSSVTWQRKQLYQKPLNFIPKKIKIKNIFTQLLTNYCKEFKENSKFFSIVRKAKPYHTVTVQWCICSIFFINQVFGLLTIIKPLRKAISNGNCNHEILLQLPSGWVTNFTSTMVPSLSLSGTID